jgi:hypothetical protein
MQTKLQLSFFVNVQLTGRRERNRLKHVFIGLYIELALNHFAFH